MTLVITVALVAGPLAWSVLPLDRLLRVAVYVEFRRARSIALEARRRWPPLLVDGEIASVEVEVACSGSRAVTVLLREGLDPAVAAGPLRRRVELRPNRPVLWTYQVTPRRRGDHRVDALTARVLGPWGLAWSQQDLLPPESVRVYPQVRWGGRVGRLLALAQRRELGQSPLPILGSGAEPYALREFRQGDPPVKIHWKATARHGRPIIREETWERGVPLLVLLDTARSMASVAEGRSKLDSALAAALALIRVASARGDRVTVLAFSDRVQQFVRLGAGARGARDAYLRLFDLEARLVEPAYDLAASQTRSLEPRRATAVLFTSVVDLASGEMLRGALTMLSRRHRVLLVNLEDAELSRLAREIPETALAAFAKISALEILLANRRLGKRLRRAGIQVVTAPADRLALETLDVYLAMQAGRRTGSRPARISA